MHSERRKQVIQAIEQIERLANAAATISKEDSSDKNCFLLLEGPVDDLANLILDLYEQLEEDDNY